MSTCYLTNAGRVLIAKMLASDRLLYTRAVTSSTTVEAPELLSTLPMAQQESRFITSEQIGDACRLTVAFTCHDLETSYQLKMLGIYAKTEAEQREILYKVLVYTTDEEQASFPAGEDITYKFVITDAVTEGELTVEMVDDLAAPAEHVFNPYRHIFGQTNSGNPAVVDCGERNTFGDGQKIVFVPRISLSSGDAMISCAGKIFRVKCANLAGENVAYTFIANQTYLLTYREADDSFFYVKHNEIEYKNGVGHIWTGAGWQTIIEAGRIISSVADTAPAGTLLCDGSSLERSSYPELFAVVGTKFGAVDDAHFNLPDLGGRSLIGANSTHALGSTGGEETHLLLSDELPEHSHAFSVTTSNVSHSHTVTATVGNAGGHSHPVSGTTSASSHTHTPTVTQTQAGGHTPTVKSGSVSSAGSHKHLSGVIMDDTGVTGIFAYDKQTLAPQNHNSASTASGGTVRPNTGYTSTEGSHTHNLSITLNHVDDHGHNVKVTIPSSGSHTHPFSATTGSAGGHTHPISISIDGKAHTHTASGTTSIAGSNVTHNNMPPFMAINFYIYTGRPLL